MPDIMTKGSNELLDFTMVFFYKFKDSYNIKQVAGSVKLSESELILYLNHLKEKNLITESEDKPSRYKITFSGITFCETDSFRNPPNTPEDKKLKICQLYDLSE